MSEIRQKDSTSNTFYVLIRSKTSTPVGMGLTGLVYNTPGLVLSYVRDGAARVAIALVTQTVTGAWASGGFVEIDAANSPGLYRLDIPNAAVATGAKKVRVTWTGANSYDDGTEIDLTADDPYAAGLTTADIATAVRTEMDTNSADLNTLISGQATIAGYIDTEVAAIKARTDLIPAAPAAVSNIPTAAQIADGLLQRNAKGGADGPAASSVAAAIAGGFMKMDILGAVLTMRYADGTVAFTRTVTRAQLDAITAAA